MSAGHILVLQMQRMGDLVLTFPLFLWLSRLYPDRRIFVAAEEGFYEGLLSVSPYVTYIPWREIGAVRNERFGLVMNLSHRPEAAALAGEIRAEEKIGPVREASGHTYIRGAWQLYRASLVRNNRHNRYHWAELNALDAVAPGLIASTTWTAPEVKGDGRRIGLFLGASEEAKRPSAAFWAELARELLRRNLRPILLGGPAETGLAEETARLAGGGINILNLAGRLSLAKLAKVASSLDLLVTPDTGPMHLGAWVGARVLNLSMGPVQPWETGPYQPGHHVLSQAASCAGCWACRRGREGAPGPCREAFRPARVAGLCRRLASGEDEAVGRMRLPGMDLRRTGRLDNGLYGLRSLWRAREGRSGREALDDFWSAWFGWRFGLWDEAGVAGALSPLALDHPRLAERLGRGVAEVGRSLTDLIGGRGSAEELAGEAWLRRFPPLVRPLAGYLQHRLQNCDFSLAGAASCLELLEDAARLVSRL